MLDFCIIYIELFSSYAIKPEKAIGWSWKDAMSNYGYLTCLVEDFGNTINPYMEPEGYNEKVITIKNNSKKSETEVYPDIVLILNESFFDLSVYCDMKTDHNYMEKFYSIDNAVYGYAVTPSIGGGTNNSEYELLTTHSMSLLRSPAPFNYVDLAASDNNIVRYVEGLGYKTYGMHCQNGSNIHVILHILQ